MTELTIKDLKSIREKLWMSSGRVDAEIDRVISHAIDTTHQRDLLLEIIQETAINVGILKEDASIDGPMAIILLDNFMEYIKHLESQLYTEEFEK